MNASWHTCKCRDIYIYEAATISRLLKNTGLFAQEPYKRNLYSAKETYTLKEPASHSHHIGIGMSHIWPHTSTASTQTANLKLATGYKCVLVMPHIWMSHGTHMNESWPHMNASWRTYEWVMAHICMSHDAHVNESWHTYKWVMAHT